MRKRESRTLDDWRKNGMSKNNKWRKKGKPGGKSWERMKQKREYKSKKTQAAGLLCCPSSVQLLLNSNNAVPLIPLTRLTQH